MLVKHEEMLKLLREICLDGKKLSLIQKFYLDQKSGDRVENELIEYQGVQRGGRQGCFLLHDLYNIYSQFIMQFIKELVGIKIGGKNITYIRYADDTTLSIKIAGSGRLLSEREQYEKTECKYCKNPILGNIKV